MLYLITKLVTGFASTPHHEGDGHDHEGDACACIPLDPTWSVKTEYAGLPNIGVYGATCAGAFRASNTANSLANTSNV